MPMAPARREKILTNPPLTREEEAMITPMIPEMMAMTAKTKPRRAPVEKLRTAAMMAMMEKTLKVAFVVVGSFMRQIKAPDGGGKAGVFPTQGMLIVDSNLS